jgi:hypothetical protein
VTRRALAETSDAPVPIRFEFRSSRCGSAGEFVAKVEQRSTRIRLLEGRSADRSLIVEIQRPDASGALQGTVTVVEADGATRARKLKAKSCAEAMAGLSLIATVTLDPEALLSAAEEPPPPSPPLPPPPAPVAPPAAAAEPISAAPARPAPARAQYRVSFGLEAAVLVSLSPEPALGGGAAAAFELSPGELVSPLLRLSVAHVQRRHSPAGAGEANFAFTLPSLELCPVRLGPRVVGIRPCAYGSLGLIEVWGSGGVQSETYRRAAGSAGAGLLFSWRSSEAFEIIADGRGGVPFSRDEFAFDDVVFFRTRPLVFSAVVGVAGGFP